MIVALFCLMVFNATFNNISVISWRLYNVSAPFVHYDISLYSQVSLPLYEKILNLIFETGFLPDIWLIGSIKPIYKNKGNPLDPKNFRPITILSCLGKLFTPILNERLRMFSEEVFC